MINKQQLLHRSVQFSDRIRETSVKMPVFSHTCGRWRSASLFLKQYQRKATERCHGRTRTPYFIFTTSLFEVALKESWNGNKLTGDDGESIQAQAWWNWCNASHFSWRRGAARGEVKGEQKEQGGGSLPQALPWAHARLIVVAVQTWPTAATNVSCFRRHVSSPPLYGTAISPHSRRLRPAAVTDPTPREAY